MTEAGIIHILVKPHLVHNYTIHSNSMTEAIINILVKQTVSNNKHSQTYNTCFSTKPRPSCTKT